MKLNKPTVILAAGCLLSSAFARPTYEEALKIIATAPSEITNTVNSGSRIYRFTSQFDGQDSVAYPGQTFRQVLINDLKGLMGSMKYGAFNGSESQARNVLNSFFKYSSGAPLRGPGAINGQQRHKTKILDFQGNRMSSLEGATYDSIQSPGKNLMSKIAGNDNPLRNGELKGWNSMNLYGVDLSKVDADRNGDSFVEPDDLVQGIFQVVAKNAATGASFIAPNGSLPGQTVKNASITPDGVNLTEIMHKFLQGAIAFSQAAGDYLATDLGPTKGLNADNTQPYKGSKNHTALEHFWDEGFGYFGAARDFATYTDAEIRKYQSKDTDGDGVISIHKEYNIGGVALNSARIDRYSAQRGTGTLDLTKEAIDAFLAGRQLITEKPANYTQYIPAYATVALAAWEKTLGAVVIHYLNATLKQMDAYGTEDYLFVNYAKFWSEMKGYGMIFQFNPTSLVSLSDFVKMHQLFGDHPVALNASAAAVAGYRNNLLQARELLRKSLGLSSMDAQIF